MLIEIENADIKSRNKYILICALNFELYKGMMLYDNDAKESVEFSVSSQAPQEIKNKLFQIVKEYFNTL